MLLMPFQVNRVENPLGEVLEKLNRMENTLAELVTLLKASPQQSGVVVKAEQSEDEIVSVMRLRTMQTNFIFFIYR